MKSTTKTNATTTTAPTTPPIIGPGLLVLSTFAIAIICKHKQNYARELNAIVLIAKVLL